MWWSSRLFALAAAALLAGCGYQPVYDTAATRGVIAIDDPVDPAGFALVNQLERRLGIAEAPQYRLSAEIRINDDGLGITPDETITRYVLDGRVRYRLSDLETAEELRTGEVRNFTSYSATSTTVATQSARRDARERLMVILADQIAAELTLSEPDWRR